ncbi:class I SAM-dependent methyltransferase [Zestomonas carbonaria]|uniref:Methyltransferase type 11 domain-containing protein n=1 Tax=Zestomonas carbonaria TaxID=2762745 RepID=A0A7U7I877_9GAMM|nr:class I SAM-dependent methyltransferase [Pseudomonas carbonaria]CAD5107034.1 hypothetical protein PSEWESI4_01305 [Pseudomonas carbonaria]
MSDPRQLFTRQSAAYRTFRPTYDAQLFAWLAERAPARGLAWDCACGSGQATLDLARHFQRVVATDVSQAQLDQAPTAANIDYRCEPAEHSSLAEGSVDLTLVAQALHWFDVDAFHAEVRRVSRPGALLAVLSYNLLEIEPALDALVGHLYHDVVGPYWATGRRHVENGYADLPFPLPRLEVPPFGLHAQWSLEHLLGYLQSWSAVADYRAAEGVDPVERLRPEFARAWGETARLREVRWPLTVNLGVVTR